MLYLITQFDAQDIDIDIDKLMEQGSQLNKMLLQEGCRLLMHSDQFEFSIFNLTVEKQEQVKKICETFMKYCTEVVKVDFQFELFTWDEIEQSGDFSPEFIEALRSVEGNTSH